jgi:hypothetical protein
LAPGGGYLADDDGAGRKDARLERVGDGDALEAVE